MTGVEIAAIITSGTAAFISLSNWWRVRKSEKNHDSNAERIAAMENKEHDEKKLSRHK